MIAHHFKFSSMIFFPISVSGSVLYDDLVYYTFYKLSSNRRALFISDDSNEVGGKSQDWESGGLSENLIWGKLFTGNLFSSCIK
jgi:hypothetical protein